MGRFSHLKAKHFVRLYTRTGDKGETGIGGGQRLAKDSPRMRVIGEIDELNSFVGWAVVSARAKEKGILQDVQKKLFIASAELANAIRGQGNKLLLDEQEVAKVERWIDWYQARVFIAPKFVLPGGCELAGRLHLCRTVCRRAERSLARLNKEEKVNPDILKFLNRLSDLFYALARWENKRVRKREIFWR